MWSRILGTTDHWFQWVTHAHHRLGVANWDPFKTHWSTHVPSVLPPSWNIWFVTAWLWPLTWLTVSRLSGCFFFYFVRHFVTLFWAVRYKWINPTTWPEASLFFCHLQWGLSRVCVRVQHVNGTFLSSSLSQCHAENTKSTYFEQKKKLQKVFQLTAACFHSMLWFTLCVEVCWLFPSRLTVFKNLGFVLASKKKKKKRDSHYLVNVFFFIYIHV